MPHRSSKIGDTERVADVLAEGASDTGALPIGQEKQPKAQRSAKARTAGRHKNEK